MRIIMRNLKMAVALAGAIGFGIFVSGVAQAAPVSNAAGVAAATLNLVEQTQYVYGGHRHCWYADGWHGAGWYRCGYRWRRGYGWGGVAGWNGWASPGVVVVAPGPYLWNGRHYHHRKWRRGQWYYY
jgi:hypothetical protein